MRVFVAILAFGKLHFIPRIFAGWNMTFRTFHFSVHAFERIFGCGVFLNSKERRLPTVHGMAIRTFAFGFLIDKLTTVGIGCMAVGALLKSNGPLEVSGDMACNAVYS